MQEIFIGYYYECDLEHTRGFGKSEEKREKTENEAAVSTADKVILEKIYNEEDDR